MLQEPFLFRGTIWQNLVYGLPTSTPEQAIAAAKAAQAHDFILNSPLGYDTWLGERGAGLSGGERQRLSIARAILYDPPILVLDEATSNVDAESEQAIQQALRALTRGRTTIAIAHRLSTLREADRILVFDRGRLIEQGSHEELIAQDGQYAKLVRLQGRCQAGEMGRRGRQERFRGCPDRRVSFTSLAGTRRRGDSRRQPRRMEVTLTGRRNLPRRLCREPLSRHQPRRLHQPARLEPRRRRTGNRHPPAARPVAGRGPVARSSRSGPPLLLQTITGVDEIRLELGHLTLAVRTDHGPRRFTMRWSQSQVQDFGERGKVLLDLDDNRFLVPDVEALPPRERDLFQRYVYW